MQAFGVIVANLPGLLDLGTVVAASRCGALGVLNLEAMEASGEVARESLQLIRKSVGNSFGLKLDSDASAATLLAALPDKISAIILTPGANLPEVYALARRATGQLFLEVRSSREASLADGLAFDALIAKGHEAGGFIGEETAFILLQRLRAERSMPVWVHGGVGPNTAAGCYAAGAAGVVIDNQVLLTPECSLAPSIKRAVSRMSGDETISIGAELGIQFRAIKRTGHPALENLRQMAGELALDADAGAASARWQAELCRSIQWTQESETGLWPLGQDAALAGTLAKRHRNVAGIVKAIRDAVSHNAGVAARELPLQANAPLAQSHGVKYPILQGPMTRVSDVAAFARAVAADGGLPFLALALLRGPQVRELLSSAQKLMGAMPWGVGILGFVPPELRAEQLAVVTEFKPPFAIIAGGRPDQAVALEAVGITSYIHVPAPSLLPMFLEDGARHFIFEGRECGGHVGPRTSFVLWESMIEVLLDAISKGVEAKDLRVVFAGGIHDGASAAFVSAMAAPLVEKGVQIGVLLGTAYLFTHEAAESGAITEEFQREALECGDTVLLESGPGHTTRCAATPFHQTFLRARRTLLAEKKTVEEIRDELEHLNLGRLRMATKGIAREERNTGVEYVKVSAEQQRAEGLYMIGQVATLRHERCSIGDLHASVSVASADILTKLALPARELPAVRRSWDDQPCDIAIVGMGCLLPQAPDVAAFWRNLLGKVDAIREIPAGRFNSELYYDADRKARDKIYSRWGGFLESVAFDPMRFGIPPNSLASIDPMQLLALVAVEQALEDAGYRGREFDRSKAAVILGMSGGLGDLGIGYAMRANLPMHLDGAPAELLDRLPEWTEDSFAGILLNVTSGRIANRFDFGGVNFTVDAACASSLAAIYSAARELVCGSSDFVVAGGVDTVQSPFGYLCFAKAQALSPSGRCRPFDETADGIAISEGVTMLVLKRLADAERDGDRIYAVLKGVAGSSDGRGKSLTAPRQQGQVAALYRAYAQAGFGPGAVGLIEAHGTGTVAGDETEIASLSEVFQASEAAVQSCAIGSVKSMLGHTKATAGVTGLMKVALALHRKVLPPTLHITRPNGALTTADSPFFLNTEPQRWIRNSADAPRRAGVSAFGFGGTNFHAALEEYTGDLTAPLDRPGADGWPCELFLWNAATPAALMNLVGSVADSLVRGARPSLPALALALARQAALGGVSGLRLAVVAASLDELGLRLNRVRESLERGETEINDTTDGVYLSGHARGSGKIAFLFPGQGSQYPGMLRQHALYLPDFLPSLERADAVLAGKLPQRLSRFIYPPTAFSDAENKEQMARLTRTVVAQPALAAVELALCKALQRCGVRPDMTAGHSFGEYVALASAGVYREDDLFRIAEARGRSIEEAIASGDAGCMAAVGASEADVRRAVADMPGVVIANLNAPQQTIIAGETASVQQASAKLQADGVSVRSLPVACAFHSPLMDGARERLGLFLASAPHGTPKVPVYSNTTAAAYPAGVSEIRSIVESHLVSPVRFVEQLSAMHDDGARVFIEVGPKGVLSGLARQILRGRDATILQTDATERGGMEQFVHVLGRLAAIGVALDAEEIFRRRVPSPGELASLLEPQPAPAFYVNGTRAYPASQPPATKAPLKLLQPPAPIAAAAVPTPANPAAQAPSVPYAAPALDASVDAVMLNYQQMMARIVESQTALMTTFLQSGGAGAGAYERIVPAPPATVVQPKFAAAAVQQASAVNLPPARQNGHHAPAPPERAAVAPVRDFAAELLKIASDRTGYPTDLLDPNAALEADLGIDSIKRVEILSAFQRLLSPREQALVKSGMERLTKAKTLAEIASRAAELTASTEDAPAAPTSAAVNSPEKPAADSSVDVAALLLQITSERTGYPVDMLDVDAAMEADLGIDSIKRVEILGALQRQLPSGATPAIQGIMETLTRSRTLGEVVRHMSAALRPAPAPAATEISQGGAPRFRLMDQELDRLPKERRFHPGRLCLITDDDAGLASRISAALARGGERAIILHHSRSGSSRSEAVVELNLTDPSEVAGAVAWIRQRHGEIGALVHLLPLSAAVSQPPGDLAANQECVRLGVKSLYLLSRELSADLEKRGAENGALVCTVTGRGGSFGLATGAAVSAAQFAAADFTKTLAREFTRATCKVIDLDPSDPLSIKEVKLVDEIASRETLLQVGRPGNRRVTVAPVLTPLTLKSALHISRDWVIVLTGGARGITSQFSRLLAAKFQPKIVLIGATALPATPESSETAGITDPARLKQVLLARLRLGGASVKPGEIERAWKQLLREREILASLEDLRKRGASVEYHSLDVRDAAAFKGCIDEIYRRYGRLDVFVHGAGIIEDKLVVDKMPESFERVVGTKVDSSFILSQALHLDSLKCLVFMSSITAAFGNRGQADYAAANGFMNGLATQLSAQKPGHVVAMNWGPWDQGGMVTDAMRKQFEAQGVGLISPEAGAQCLLEEISAGARCPIVVIGAGPWATENVLAQAALSGAVG